MRRELSKRLRKIEAGGAGATFTSITIYANSPDEQKAILARLQAEGIVRHGGFPVRYEPREAGKPEFEVEELPVWWIGQMLREIDGDARKYNFPGRNIIDGQ